MPSLRSGIGAHPDLLKLDPDQTQQRPRGRHKNRPPAVPSGMTARTAPPRTTLPPGLARHYYETQRLIAQGEGKELPPWYRLTVEQRLAVEQDLEIFRQAILRAEEEQALIASCNTSTAQPPQTTKQPTSAAAGDSTSAENCRCSGCTVVAAKPSRSEVLRASRSRPGPTRHASPSRTWNTP